MARIRSIHPDTCVSETLARLTAEAERTFFRLLTQCDDHGRIEDRPKRIRALIYPMHEDVTSADVERWLGELVSVGVVFRYEVGGEGFIQVHAWREFQHPKEPTPSRLPAPPGWGQDDPPPTPEDEADKPTIDLTTNRSEHRSEAPDSTPATPEFPTGSPLVPHPSPPIHPRSGVEWSGVDNCSSSSGLLNSEPDERPPDDDDGSSSKRHPQARAAIRRLALSDLDDRRRQKPDDAPPVASEREKRWLRSTMSGLWADLGAQVDELAAAGHDAAAIAAAVRAPMPDNVHPLRPPPPRCPDPLCGLGGGNHTEDCTAHAEAEGAHP